jgi:LysM repeat protein
MLAFGIFLVLAYSVNAQYFATNCTGIAYTVQSSDVNNGWWGISTKFTNCNSNAIQTANPTASSVGLYSYTGKQICIPSPCSGGTTSTSGGSSSTTTCSGTQYTIKSGDTFYALAGGVQTCVSAIQAANPNAVATNLQIGQSLCLPSCASATVTCVQYYTIKAGDTFNGLANYVAACAAAIQAVNPNAVATNLQIGYSDFII